MKDFIKKWNLFGVNLFKFNNKNKIEVIIWGTGKFSTGLTSFNKFLKVKFYIDDRIKGKSNKKINGVPILSSRNLKNDNTPILIATSYAKSAFNILKKEGIKNIYLINQFSPRWINFNISPKIWIELKKEFLNKEIKINQLKLNHKLTHKYYFYFKGNLKRLEKILYKNLFLDKSSKEKDKHPIVMIFDESPCFFNEIPVIPYQNKDMIKNLNNKFFLQNLNKYLILFWEPICSIKDKRLKVFFKLKKINKSKKKKIIKNFLDSKYGPSIDFARKWFQNNTNNYFHNSVPIKLKKNGNLGVFFLRSWFKKRQSILHLVLHKINQLNLSIIFSKKLLGLEIDYAKIYTRGGYWKDTQNIKDGLPYWIIVFEYKDNINLQLIKENLRKICSKINSGNINVVHSSDDTLEAVEYLKCLKKIPFNDLLKKFL